MTGRHPRLRAKALQRSGKNDENGNKPLAKVTVTKPVSSRVKGYVKILALTKDVTN